ncbi:MAG: TnpV protein [Merdibacter sp.]
MMNQKKCMPVGDYFIPAIDLKPVADKVLNKYGRMRRAFLQEQKPILF